MVRIFTYSYSRWAWDDVARTVTEVDVADAPIGPARPWTPEEAAAWDRQATADTEATSAATLTTRARTAIQGNKDFLALASPTNAQTLAQVKALTRQANALIKLEVRDLLDTTGT